MRRSSGSSGGHRATDQAREDLREPATATRCAAIRIASAAGVHGERNARERWRRRLRRLRCAAQAVANRRRRTTHANPVLLRSRRSRLAANERAAARGALRPPTRRWRRRTTATQRCPLASAPEVAATACAGAGHGAAARGHVAHRVTALNGSAPQRRVARVGARSRRPARRRAGEPSPASCCSSGRGHGGRRRAVAPQSPGVADAADVAAAAAAGRPHALAGEPAPPGQRNCTSPRVGAPGSASSRARHADPAEVGDAMEAPAGGAAAAARGRAGAFTVLGERRLATARRTCASGAAGGPLRQRVRLRGPVQPRAGEGDEVLRSACRVDACRGGARGEDGAAAWLGAPSADVELVDANGGRASGWT